MVTRLRRAAPLIFSRGPVPGSGDGIADGAAGPVFVPFALPGETVLATVAGERAG